MSLIDLSSRAHTPDMPQLSAYINNALWDELCSHIEQTYGVSPNIEYSTCSMQPGWNVKYKKGGRALCTLYPAKGSFTAMVSIGAKEANEAELMLPTLTEYTRELYQNTRELSFGRWLMIDVASPEVLEDAKRLISLRVRKK